MSKNLDYIIIDREHGAHSFSETNILNKVIQKIVYHLLDAAI